MRIAILLSVFNRKDKTLECLTNVYRQIDSLASQGEYSFDIYLNDDMSTDGLSEAVKEKFPSVNIIRSEQEQFQYRGLRMAWLQAAKNDYDFYLWLDYDLNLNEGAFAELLENSNFLRHKALIVGSVNSIEGKLMYGGRSKSGKLIAPDPTIPIPCYTFDGDLLLVPKYAFDLLGTVDEEYQQSLADYDYGSRAVKAGINRVIAPGILATCDRVLGLPVWQDKSYSLSERYKYLQSPKGRPLKQQFIYDLRSRGIAVAIWNFLKINFLTLFPKKRK